MKVVVVKTFLLVLVLFCARPFFGTPYAQVFHVDLKDGLSDLTVNAIAQDSLGIIYFGTENGLTVYDGNQFESFYSNASSSTISDNTIYSIMVDYKDRVWIGNWKGIDLYDRKHNSFKKYQVGNSNYRIGAIYQDSKQRIWIGAFGLGLCYFDEARDSIITLKNPLLDFSSISSITEDIRGNLWIGTESNGLFLLQPNQQKVFSFESDVPGVCKSFGFKNNRIRAIVNFDDGNMMIGTYDKGAFVYNSHTMQITPFGLTNHALNSQSHIATILQDDDKNLWFAIDGGGIVKYNHKEERLIDVAVSSNPQNTLTSKLIRNIFFDKNRTLWIGTYKNGVDFTYEANMKKFNFFQPSSEFKSVTAIEKLTNSKYLIGTDGSGLLTFDSNLNEFSPSKSVSSDNILSFYNPGESDFWVGTFTKGVLVIDKSLSVKKNFNGQNCALDHNDIRCIVGDKSTIYIGTNGKGLKIYNILKDEFDTFGYDYFNPEKGIVYFGVNTLLLDSRGILWIGTRDGMTIYEPRTKRFVNVKALPGRKDADSYNCFYEDLKGNIWAGTNRGLIKFNQLITADFFNQTDADFISRLNVETFLVNDKDLAIVNSIVEDNIGNLWLGSNHGLVRFNIKNSSERYYFQEEGVSLSVFNSNSAYKDDGYLYFGGNTGLLYFKPEEVSANLPAPNVILTSLLVNMKELKVKDEFQGDEVLSSHINFAHNVEINPGAKIVSIQFSSTNSFLSSEIEYAYRLEGLNNEWVNVSGRNLTAAFTNLSAGTYNFQVKARYRHGEWNNSIRELQIIILPPFWETIWFRSLFFLAIVAALYYSYQRRIKIIKHRNLVLERLVQEKSAELLEEKDAKLIELEKKRQLISEKEHAERERLLLENEIQWAQSEKLRLELELKTQLENTINGELSASLVQVTKKNDLLKWLKIELNHLLTVNPNNVVDDIKAIIRKIDSEFLFQEDWQKFENHFNVVYSDFIQKMKTTFPDLTSKELRLCSYIKMNLTSSEIAQLSNITMRGVEKSRSRLRKKLDLNGNEDLYEYILNFDSKGPNSSKDN